MYCELQIQNKTVSRLTSFVRHPVSIDPSTKTIPEEITSLITPLSTRVEQ